ncbi:ribonuclease E/G [Sneathiella sp.]|jgi:ribonuclease G|uniref:ribonuclease E/G n=1 Tax=Sneathiella sp. TaxID=1964365 RepID=UPI0039E4527B
MTATVLFDDNVPGLRAAVVDGETVKDLFIFPQGKNSEIGNVYLGRIATTSRELEAAFVDLGGTAHAFLKLRDIPSNIHLHEGLKLIVQVIKEAHDNKPKQISAFIRLEGQFSVFAPNGTTIAFAKQLNDPAFRDALILQAEEAGVSGGITVRSAARNHPIDTTISEIVHLQEIWQAANKAARQEASPRLLFSGEPPECQIAKTAGGSDAHLITNSTRIYKNLKQIFSEVTLWSHADLLFDHFNIESQIDDAREVRLPLPSGGSVTIEKTEALIAIDVNSGGTATSARQTAHTLALQTNKEAAALITAQLRLRNLAGIIIIDFIQMNDKQAIRTLTQDLKELCQTDPSPVRVIGMAELGLMQLTRQRKNADLQTLLSSPADQRQSTPSFFTATNLINDLMRFRHNEKSASLTIVCSPQIASYLALTKKEIEAHTALSVKWTEDPNLKDDAYIIRSTARDEIRS